MKTRLLCMLLFISSITFSQNWTQVGAAQFTDFSNNAEIAFHPVTGNPYIVTSNPANNEIKVKAYNGTSWSDFSPVLSTVGHNNMDIKFNPINNDLWVVLKRNGSGTSSTLDVYKYNAATTTWTAEATNFLSGGGFYSHGVQIQFSSTGTPRIAATVSGGSGRLKVVLLDYQGTNNWTVTNDVNELNLRKDFTGYNEYFWTRHRARFASFEGTINKRTLNPVNNSFNKAFYPSQTLQVSGIKGTNYAVSNDVVGVNTTINPRSYPDIIFTNGANSNVPQPLNTRFNTNNILKFRKSRNNNNFYLMFSANDQSLVFQKFNGSAWSYVPSVGIQTSATGFFVDMEMNQVDGNMYIVYQDGGKASVKKFSIESPLSKYYVNANVSGGNGSGNSWANAMPSLQTALGAAGSNTTEIWVAAGTYKPGTARSNTFQIPIDNLQLYGGFNGTETSVNERDILANPTILSGDINGDDQTDIGFPQEATGTSRRDNNYHIMDINANNVVVDGLIIEGGYADGAGTDAYGGAILIRNASQNPTLKNCTFKENMGLTGGAIRWACNSNSTMNIENCKFINNLSRLGAGLYCFSSASIGLNLNITNSLFVKNVTKNQTSTNKGYAGSSIWVEARSAGSTVTTTINNCTFANNSDSGNQTVNERGTLTLARKSNATHNATINNSIVFNNTGFAVNRGNAEAPNTTFVYNSIGQGNFSNLTFLNNTSGADPLFTDANNNDYTLQTGSPAIDSGDNSKIPSGIITDLAGNNRIHNTIVDMGAYEFGASPIVYRTLNIIAANGSVTTNPTGTSFIDGASVTLTATPDSGYQFDNWSGDATGATNPLTIVMNADKSITANFSLIPAPTPSFANLPSNATGAFTATINFDTAVTGFVMSDIQVSGATLSNFNAVSATQYTVLVTPTTVCNTPSITLEVPANVATDSNNSSLNNLTSGVQTINVTDNAVPVVTPQNITVQLDANGQVTITPQQINNGSSDNCSIASMSLDKTSFTCADLGANQVVLTVVDSSNNSNTATATVTVEDSIAPTAVAQNLSVQLGTNGQVSVTPQQINNGSSDNCTSAANLTYSLSQTNFTCNDLGTNNVTLTVADASGNQATATAVVTVSQNPNAQLAAVTQNITVQLDVNGQATITPQQIDNGSGSGCNSNPTLSLDKTTFDCSNVGANTVTLTATDNGNSVSATATVTVQDTTQPAVVSQNITVQLDASGNATITPQQVDNGSSDNCSIASMSLDTTSFTCANTGANQVVLTVVDANGNSNTATATVTVEDSIAPTAVVQNLSVQLGTNGQVSVTPAQINNGSSDNCTSAANLTYNLSKTNFTCNDLGANNVTLTVADASGNQGTATAVVTVSQNPNAQLAAVTQNITIQLDANGQATITPQQIDNGSGSGCNSNPTLSLDKTTFDCSNVGTNTVTLTATDNGNSVTGTAVVTVQDATQPTIIAQNITVQLDASGNTTITPQQIDNGTSDNCSIASMSLDTTSFTCANIGANQVVLTVVDSNNNTSTATATVTVEDSIAPTVMAQNISVQLGANNQVSITPSQINNGSSDNCTSATNLTYSLDTTTFSCSEVGTNTVTLTVEDASGNQSTATAVVTVTANPTAPLAAVAQNITVQLDASGSVTIQPSDVDNGSGSGCNSNPTLSLDKTTFDCSNIGANTVILTATDGGATETATAIVTVEDSIAPTVNTKDVTVTLSNGQGTITVADVDDNSTDNCSVASTSLDTTSFTCADLGTNTVTLTVTDGQGNVATGTATVTVVETAAPTVVTQNITVALDANGAATITPQQVDNGSSDACSGIASMSLDTTSFQCPDLSAPQTVTLTVTDNSGNTATGTATVTFTAPDEDNDGISDACDTREVVTPKGFSPNGDGQNDTWTIENIEKFPNSTLEVFNRWGEKVYQANNYQNNWDGTSNQKGGSSTKLPAGAYYYIINLNDSEFAPVQGWLYINY